MKKVVKLFLMLGLALSGALCYVHGAAKTENEKETGAPKIAIIKSHHSGTDKSGSIDSSINGHVLTVIFCENLGQVSIEVLTDTGATVDCLSVLTPNGIQVYITNAGDYIVNFTLPDGDEYYGEFTITE